MRWEDERYVRLYTRDTAEFLALSWQARGLFALILRKADRAGFLAVGRLGLRGLAPLVGAPWVEIEAPLRELLDDGCVHFDAGNPTVVSLPNFVEAQECIQSGKVRQQAYRERLQAQYGGSPYSAEVAHRALRSSGEKSDSVTQRHDCSDAPSPIGDARDETGDAVTQPVTPSLPSLPSLPNHPNRGESARARTTPPEAQAELTGVAEAPSRPTTRPGAKTRGSRIPDDWEPKPETLERFRTRERVDASLAAERFRNHWRFSTGRNAVKLDWDLAFVNWVLRDIADGILHPAGSAPPTRGGRIQQNSGAEFDFGETGYRTA